MGWNCDGPATAPLTLTDLGGSCSSQNTATMRNKTINNPCSPYLVLPPVFKKAETSWSTYSFLSALIWDPPRVLKPAAALGPTTSILHQSETSPAAPGSGLSPPIVPTTSVYISDPPVPLVSSIRKPDPLGRLSNSSSLIGDQSSSLPIKLTNRRRSVRMTLQYLRFLLFESPIYRARVGMNPVPFLHSPRIQIYSFQLEPLFRRWTTLRYSQSKIHIWPFPIIRTRQMS